MTKKEIQKKLEEVLLHDGKMDFELYKHDVEESIPPLIASMRLADNNCIFAVTVNKHKVRGIVAAMVLIEKSGAIHINEAARDKLKKDWKIHYATNMQKILPGFVQKIKNLELAVMGVSSAIQA